MDSPFVQRLLVVAPELHAIYQLHLRQNDEPLSFVFMGDVTRKAIEASGSNSANEFLDRLLIFFEKELASQNGDAQELVALGFCENLMGERHAQNALAPKMGPLLFEMMKRFAR